MRYCPHHPFFYFTNHNKIRGLQFVRPTRHTRTGRQFGGSGSSKGNDSNLNMLWFLHVLLIVTRGVIKKCPLYGWRAWWMSSNGFLGYRCSNKMSGDIPATVPGHWYSRRSSSGIVFSNFGFIPYAAQANDVYFKGHLFLLPRRS